MEKASSTFTPQLARISAALRSAGISTYARSLSEAPAFGSADQRTQRFTAKH